MDAIALILVVVALLAGLGLGWFLGSRPVAEWRTRHGEAEAAAKMREAEVKEHAERLARMAPELATMSCLLYTSPSPRDS